MEIISDEASKPSTVKEQENENRIDYSIITVDPIIKSEFPTVEDLDGLKPAIKEMITNPKDENMFMFAQRSSIL